MKRGKHSKVWFLGPLAFKIFNKGFLLNAKKEYKSLRILKKYKLAPTPYFRIGRLIAMSKINGRVIKDFTPDEVKLSAKDFLLALHQLDKLDLMKEESHRPHKHFFLTKDGVRLIDFERTKKGHGNVTQFLSYLKHVYPNITKLGKKYKETLDLKPILKFIARK
ncbi:MAG: hypothetical protein GOU98_00185 [Candidatus Altiarchaeota archaeon]|nr:hypothetical protein [Candidatus Altiarchaeota archaeon]